MLQVTSRFFWVFVLLFPMFSEAATLYIDPPQTDIHPGDTITVAVRIDTDDEECINVIDGVIDVTGTVIPVDISRGESILPVWVEEPTIDKERGKITFAGGIPNGYCGRIEGDPRLSNVVLEIALQAPGTIQESEPQTDTAEIIFNGSTRVLLNDGRGSSAPLRTLGSTIFLHDTPDDVISDEWNTRVEADTIAPGKFSISLERDPSIFSNQYFIVFNTTDKQTGIDHYEAIEEPLDDFNLFRWGAADAPWVRVNSPYLLEDQSLNSTIRVKAVDKAGNEYIATLVPDNSLRGISARQTVYIALGITGAFVLMALLVVLFAFRGRREQSVPSTEFSDEFINEETKYDQEQ